MEMNAIFDKMTGDSWVNNTVNLVHTGRLSVSVWNRYMESLYKQVSLYMSVCYCDEKIFCRLSLTQATIKCIFIMSNVLNIRLYLITTITTPLVQHKLCFYPFITRLI